YFTFRVYSQLLREHPVRNGRHDFHNTAHLLGEVSRHDVNVVRQILPRTGYTGHLRLTSEFALRTDFTGDAGHFRGKCIELIHHGVDGVLELENFAFYVDGDFAGQVAACHGRGYFGDVADLSREVSCHGVDRVGQILPGSGNAGHVSLTTQPA